MARLDLLKKTFLFAGFSKTELARVVDDITEVRIPAGTAVFKQGDRATSMFLVCSGAVEVLKEGSSDTQFVVAELGEGALFGEVPFVDAEPRVATITAKRDCVLLELKYSSLRALIESDSVIGMKTYQAIALGLCERIRRTTSDYASVIMS